MDNNKVLLINTNLIRPPIAPIALDYLGSCLEDNGFSIELLDLNFSNDILKDINDKLKNETYLIIGMNIRNTDDCYFLSQFDFLPQIKDMIKQVRKYSDAPVVIGGGGFSIMPLSIMELLDADYGVIGDGEVAFLDLLNNIKDKVEIERLVGARYCSLEHMPSGRRDLIDNQRYFNEGGMGNVETSRGCDRGCIYCADPIIKGSNLRTRPVKTVICEIKNLLKIGIDVIHFCDSEFNIPVNYSRELLREMIENKIGEKLRWYSYMSPEYIDEEFVSLLKRAGCEGVNFGIDSASSEIIKNLGRKHSTEDLTQISLLFKKHSIKFMFDLILGGPGENRETIRDTIETVKRLDPICAGISYGIRVYPGTMIAEMIKERSVNSKKSKKIVDKILYGNTKDNNNFIKPVFYISPEIGASIVSYTNEIVENDDRFFIGATEDSEKNYNYNENLKLQDAIKKGYRGAYWDILRQIVR